MSMPKQRKPGAIVARLLGLVLVAVIAGAVVAAMAVPMIGGIGVVSRDAVQEFESLPDAIETPPLPQQSTILANDGSHLATLYYQNRVEIPLGAIAPVMRQATIAVEDARFLDHNGVDVRGTLRAALSNTGAGDIQQGGSTLTMQYVKNVLVNQATNAEELEAARGQTPIRKLREMRYALALEKRFTKEELLERYMNIVYFGAGAHGVEAAAQRYFSKPASDLNLAEAATLAGIVQQPTAFDPLRNPGRAQNRRDVVLRRMLDLDFITPRQYERAKRTSVEDLLKPTRVANGCTTSYAPYFCDYVLQSIRSSDAFGETLEEREAFLRRGGYTIRTTLDPQAQNAAFDAVTNAIPIRDPSRRAAAISMVQPGTGNIVAMAQNRLWGTSGRGRTTYNYNVGRDMGGTIGMQAGSAFKIFTLAAALEAGVSPFEYINAGSPRTFTGFVNCETGAQFEPVTVRNSTTGGTINMAQATAYSTNTYFMAIEERTGLCRPAEIAEEMGVTTGSGQPLPRVPSLTLGTAEVTPLAMANANATFANHGTYCEPRAILDITDRNGVRVPVPPPNCRQVMTRDVADSTTALLIGVVDGPLGGRTGARMSLGDRISAGKTGTTNESAAVWFAGFTPELAAAVWVGDPRGGFAYPMKNIEINGTYYRQVFGGTLPGPIWRASMLGALKGKPASPFALASSHGLSASNPGIRSNVPVPEPTTPAPAQTEFEVEFEVEELPEIAPELPEVAPEPVDPPQEFGPDPAATEPSTTEPSTSDPSAPSEPGTSEPTEPSAP
jgi:membrane peptidoglycan carboxypeptidase